MMLHQRKLLLGILLISLALVAGAGWWWLARLMRPPYFYVAVIGSSSSSGNLRVSGGNLFVVAPKPGVFFGTVTRPDGQESFTYLILFRYGHQRPDGPDRAFEFHGGSDGRTAETTDAIEVGGKRIEAAYRIELDETLTTVAKETLTLGGKAVDITAGQVFLVDLTAPQLEYRQKNTELPKISAKLETAGDLEQLVETVRERLKSQDDEIRAFLE